MKPIVIQRCANGVILSPMQQAGEPAPLPTEIFVFTDGHDHQLVEHLKAAIKPITHVDLNHVKAALDIDTLPPIPGVGDQLP